jgi:hypothetical protein
MNVKQLYKQFLYYHAIVERDGVYLKFRYNDDGTQYRFVPQFWLYVFCHKYAANETKGASNGAT